MLKWNCARRSQVNWLLRRPSATLFFNPGGLVQTATNHSDASSTLEVVTIPSGQLSQQGLEGVIVPAIMAALLVAAVLASAAHLVQQQLAPGTEGRKVELVANFYKFNTTGMAVFHYDLAITKPKNGNGKNGKEKKPEAPKPVPLRDGLSLHHGQGVRSVSAQVLRHEHHPRPSECASGEVCLGIYQRRADDRVWTSPQPTPQDVLRHQSVDARSSTAQTTSASNIHHGAGTATTSPGSTTASNHLCPVGILLNYKCVLFPFARHCESRSLHRSSRRQVYTSSRLRN